MGIFNGQHHTSTLKHDFYSNFSDYDIPQLNDSWDDLKNLNSEEIERILTNMIS